VGDGKTPARKVTAAAWYFLVALTVGTLAVFIVFDPNPDPVLSISTAVNVALLLWATFRLYEWNLLLSPMSLLVVVGPGMLVHYTWGNLGARIAGDARFVTNPDSLRYYPLVSLLATIGLVLYCWLVFGPFSKSLRRLTVKYENLHWQSWQAAASALIAAGLLLYLSLKYSMRSGYFIAAAGDLDRWFVAAQYTLITLAVVIAASVSVQAERRRDRVWGWCSLGLMFVLCLGLRSRNAMLWELVILAACWTTLRPARVRSILFGVLTIAAAGFILGTLVKDINNSGKDYAIWDNLLLLRQYDAPSISRVIADAVGTDAVYRAAGLELPAALAASLDRGAPPMGGEAFYAGFLSGLPSFIRPAGLISERIALKDHFYRYGLAYGDSIGIPLSSGLADLGTLASPLVYIALSIYCVLLWALAQRSPRLFLAWLMAFVNPTPFDLVWEQGFALLRAMGFAWLLLWVGGRLLMPAVPGETVRPHPAHDAVAVTPPAPAQPIRRRIAQFWLLPSFANIENTKRREDDVP
jgi:hypothetical protein